VLDDNGRVVTDSIEMAEVFNKQFSSVFTAEDVSNVPAAEKFFKGPSEEKLVDIKITAQLVRKQMQGLRADKSPGADDMSPRLLKEIVDEIAHPVAKLFYHAVARGRLCPAGEQPMSHRYSRRAAEISQ